MDTSFCIENGQNYSLSLQKTIGLENIQKYEIPIQFTNNTNYKLVIETWHNSLFIEQRIKSKEEIMLVSDVGEWFISINNCYTGKIGKFRNTPCIMGKFSWLDNDKFVITNRDNKFIFSEVL